jgi:predicted nucleotidyltransferase
MDLTDPTAAITSTLDGPVLVALANAGKPLTVSEVAGNAVRGSEIGIRKSLARLVVQGIVSATDIGNLRAYSLNRDHVASNAAIELSELRLEPWRRTARAIERWNVRPMYACIFGSAARNDGNAFNDIDLLLVRPSTMPELNDARKSKSTMQALGMWAEVVATRVMTQSQVKKWDSNVDELHQLVRRWTGNSLQVVNLTAVEWSDLQRKQNSLYLNIQRDQVRLHDEFGPTIYSYPKRGEG